MSYLITAIKNSLNVYYYKRETPYYSSYNKINNKINIFSGELHKVERYFDSINWNLCKDNLDIEESFSIISIDIEKGEIKFVNSKSGLEPIFYYKQENKFILSDDFWEIVNVLNPNENDLDRESIVEYVNLPYSLFDGTFVKGIKILFPGSMGVYSVKGYELKIERYFDFKYKPNDDLSLAEATENMNSILSKLMDDIKEECGDLRYAVGLSGGLDSRIIPFYAQKADLNISSFIIGALKPHGIFLSRDHKNARKLAKLFNIHHVELEWNKETLNKKIELDLKNYPMGTAQFFKYEFYSDYDILLTGGNGLIVGSTIPQNLLQATDRELALHIWGLARSFYPNRILNRRIEHALKFLFKKSVHIQHREQWYSEILSEDLEKKIERKLINYIEEKKAEGKNNIDIYEDYFNNIIGARNRFGGFESGCGTKRSFSIYVPRMLDETLQWPLKYLEGRPVLKKLIARYIPEASNVAEQNYVGKINGKKNIFSRTLNIGNFLIRGNGTAMEQKYFKKCRKEFLESMLNENNWFYNIFHIKKDVNKISKFDDIRFVLTVWKTKMIIDILENREYTKFTEKNYEKIL